jgi:hypothetical protein
MAHNVSANNAVAFAAYQKTNFFLRQTAWSKHFSFCKHKHSIEPLQMA